MARDVLCLIDGIDTTYSPETSIVLRYRNALRVGATDDDDAAYKACLQAASIREGARIVPLLTYRGVDLFIMDETSMMHTRTMRSLAGCVIMAKCKLQGYEAVVFESGGNSGTALTAYGQRLGIETFFFLPEENVLLLNSQDFASDLAHLIAVEKPGEVKKASHLFQQKTGLKHIPHLDWRYEASKYRGYFVLEYVMTHGGFDWLTQTISAAFGPIGIYSILAEYAAEIGELPQFLGLQQAQNCPMYRAWKAQSDTITPIEIDSTDGLLSRILYDVRPQTYGTFDPLRRLLDQTKGDLSVVNQADFIATLERLIEGRSLFELLSDSGIEVTMHEGAVVERTGLIALVGTLQAIENGTIATGSRVLCCLTSAMSNADQQAVPDSYIPSASMAAAVDTYSRQIMVAR